MIDDLYEWYWQVKSQDLGEKNAQKNFTQHRSHTDRDAIETGHLRRDAESRGDVSYDLLS
jgi:hypothetical protein